MSESTPTAIINCGRTARNSILTEALVFHQTLSTLKASYNERCPSGTPQGRTRKIHIFPKDPIMRTSYSTSPFHTLEFLKSILLQYQIPECGIINSGILKITISDNGEDLSMPVRRSLYTKGYSSSITCNRGK